MTVLQGVFGVTKVSPQISLLLIITRGKAMCIFILVCLSVTPTRGSLLLTGTCSGFSAWQPVS
jgi:hypothetical protein